MFTRRMGYERSMICWGYDNALGAYGSGAGQQDKIDTATYGEWRHLVLPQLNGGVATVSGSHVWRLPRRSRTPMRSQEG